MMMVELSAKSSAIIQAHQHVHTQMTYILDGIFEFTIETETKILKKGDTLFIESNKVHSALCLEEGKLLDVFTPARMDLI
jgi:quercetin dioxygenase-like cupin family protein